ncbi:hypothetical protein SH528x_000861 [Novipirellula sp. SH528]|uniref:hypothetical protein n=1 Tax=Novipirellula sp. SH528 TaxID=3454466 RepID=UPI003FA00DF9
MKRRLKFSLSTLLVIVTLISTWFASVHYEATQQRSTVAWLAGLHTGLWRYDSQDPSLGFLDPSSATPSGTIEQFFGPHYAHNVEDVVVYDPDLNNLDRIARLRSLTTLNVGSELPLDLDPVSRLSRLRQLTVHAESIDSLRPLHKMSNLKTVLLVDTRVDRAEINALQKARPDMQVQLVP